MLAFKNRKPRRSAGAFLHPGIAEDYLPAVPSCVEMLVNVDLSWEPSELPAGQKLQEPRPLFKKLDDSVVEEELERMRDAADAA